MIDPNILPDYESLSRHAADLVIDRLREQPSALISLAAGATPSRAYQLLAERYSREPGLFAKCRLLKLDEWGGLPIEDPATCDHQLRSALIGPLAASDRYVGFDSNPNNPEAECARIADWLRERGPIDLCILGLGLNGHIGFNEPAEYLQPHAHVAHLSPTSMNHAMLNRTAARPAYGLTLGMADLLQSRAVLVLVSGATKRDPLQRLLSGRIATSFPASFLQLHPRVTVLVDSAAHSEK
jgi:galactosamine-6-phosphate isomerase